MTEPSFRDCLASDADAVRAVFRTNVPRHFAAEEEVFLSETLASPDGPLFVLEEDGVVVGFGGYEVSDHYNQAVLVWGMIRADRHGHGLGRLLLGHRLRHLAAADRAPRWVTVDTPPHIAGFYLRCGFEWVARWPLGYRVGFDRVDLRYELTEARREALAAGELLRRPPGPVLTLAHARIFATELTAAIEFYQRVLGLQLEVDARADGFAVFRSGSMEVVLERVGRDAPDAERALAGRFTGLSFQVVDLTAAHRHLTAQGVVFTQHPELQPWGGRLATLRDPAGNEIQLVQPPTFG